MLSNILRSLAIIGAGLMTGYTLQTLEASGRIALPLGHVRLRKELQKVGFFCFIAPSSFMALWVLKPGDLRVAVLPLVGIAAIVLSGVLGVILSRLRGLSPRQTGAFFSSCLCTNMGAIGGLACYTFLGEAGFALVPLYRMFEDTTYYGVGFPVARFFGTGESSALSLGTRLRQVASDRFVRTALLAVVSGLLLNFAGIPRPAFLSTVNAWLIPGGTFVLLVSIGLGMNLGRTRPYFREGILIILVKFLLVPPVISGLGFMLGLGEINGGLPLKVVLIQASMPVAFSALIPASLYDLDLDLANACWLFSTVALVFVLPWLAFLLKVLFA